METTTVWAISLSLAATQEIDFSFYSYGYLDVSVLRVGHCNLCIQLQPVRESRDHHLFDGYPRLFAAFRALQSLLMPRHPPCALGSLTTRIECSLSNLLQAARNLGPSPSRSMIGRTVQNVTSRSQFLAGYHWQPTRNCLPWENAAETRSLTGTSSIDILSRCQLPQPNCQ